MGFCCYCFLLTYDAGTFFNNTYVLLSAGHVTFEILVYCQIKNMGTPFTTA